MAHASAPPSLMLPSGHCRHVPLPPRKVPALHGTLEGEGLGVGVCVSLLDCVGVAVSEDVGLGVPLGVPVDVCVEVCVDVCVDVCVGVRVGERESEGLLESLKVGVGEEVQTPRAAQPSNSSSSSKFLAGILELGPWMSLR